MFDHAPILHERTHHVKTTSSQSARKSEEITDTMVPCRHAMEDSLRNWPWLLAFVLPQLSDETMPKSLALKLWPLSQIDESA